jgi:glycosyltransferase involved in cell wall biosynthesis
MALALALHALTPIPLCLVKKQLSRGNDVLTIGVTLAVPDLTGASRMAFNYSQSLVRRGHSVIVLHGPEPTDPQGEKISIIEEFKNIGVGTKLVPLLIKPWPPFVHYAVSGALANVDVVIGVNQRDRAVAIKVAKNMSIPSVLLIGSQHKFWGPPLISIIKRKYYSKRIRDARLAVCTSEITRSEVVKMGLDKTRSVVLRNGIKIPRLPTSLERASFRRKYGMIEGYRVFINVGRLDKQKGLDVLIKAWSSANIDYEKNCLWIIGGTTEGTLAKSSKEYSSYLHKLVEELGVKESVRFIGWKDNVHDYLAVADCYVHAALWEGPALPLAVMEGMAYSLPTILTDCSGHPEAFVNGEHGFVVEKNNINTLSEAITKIGSLSSCKRESMGKMCRTYCEKHLDIKHVGDEFACLVERVIEDG